MRPYCNVLNKAEHTCRRFVYCSPDREGVGIRCLLGGGVCSTGSIGLSFFLVGHNIHVKSSLWERYDMSPVRIVEDLLLRLLCILLDSYRRVPRGLS